MWANGRSHGIVYTLQWFFCSSTASFSLSLWLWKDPSVNCWRFSETLMRVLNRKSTRQDKGMVSVYICVVCWGHWAKKVDPAICFIAVFPSWSGQGGVGWGQSLEKDFLVSAVPAVSPLYTVDTETWWNVGVRGHSLSSVCTAMHSTKHVTYPLFWHDRTF